MKELWPLEGKSELLPFNTKLTNMLRLGSAIMERALLALTLFCTLKCFSLLPTLEVQRLSS